MIKISNVSKIFKGKKSEELIAVNQVNLDIKSGEIYGIIGYSGAGKSTLIRMLNGLEQPTGGSVIVADKNLSELKGRTLRKARQEISMIFQHFNILWSRTVAENISLPLEIAGVKKNVRSARVAELIKLVGLDGKENFYPSQLSGGQKQRVGIARALANNPKVLLCDEATSALDPETTDAILDLLVDINQRLNLTIVLITHEMHVVRKICHRVAVMEAGNIVEVGEVLDIFKNPKQPVTKRFVSQVSEDEESKDTTKHLLEKYSSGTLLHLTFVGESAEMPILSKVIRDYSLEVNILQGKIAQTRNGSFGTLYIHLNGTDEEKGKVISFLKENEVGVEVVEHA
ncbi:MAG: methionine transporter ATP-binding protein [Bacillales bacterium]|jgi:D-methionine transport system ATP-binding protein|nr:methionine transporter ATP-binding protein [Bacillales bacterium]